MSNWWRVFSHVWKGITYRQARYSVLYWRYTIGSINGRSGGKRICHEWWWNIPINITKQMLRIAHYISLNMHHLFTQYSVMRQTGLVKDISNHQPWLAFSYRHALIMKRVIKEKSKNLELISWWDLLLSIHGLTANVHHLCQAIGNFWNENKKIKSSVTLNFMSLHRWRKWYVLTLWWLTLVVGRNKVHFLSSLSNMWCLRSKWPGI